MPENKPESSIKPPEAGFMSSGVDEKKEADHAFKAAVGLSRKWDAREAGREVTRDALEKLGTDPCFVLLFSTIHYEKYGGFQELLDGVWDVLPKETPLVGGTITGFICAEGCYTRGTVVVAITGDDIDLMTIKEDKIRVNPSIKGKKTSEKIFDNFKNSKKKNKLIIEAMSGPIEPQLMRSERIQRIFRLFPRRFRYGLSDLIMRIVMDHLGCGPSTEEDFLWSMDNVLEDYNLIGVSTFDDMKDVRHYQFYNKDVISNSFVGAVLAFDNGIRSVMDISVTPTGKSIKIKRGYNGWGIIEIEGEPPVEYMMKKVKWVSLHARKNIKQLIIKLFQHPLAFKRENQLYPFPLGLFFCGDILTNRKIRSDDLEFYLTSSKKIIENFEKYFQGLDNREVIFSMSIASSMIVSGLLRDKIRYLKDILDQYNKGGPYLLLFGSCEHLKRESNTTVFNDYSVVVSSILGEKSNCD